MQPTDGLVRGVEATDTGRRSRVPVAMVSRATCSTPSVMPRRPGYGKDFYHCVDPPKPPRLRGARAADRDARNRAQGGRHADPYVPGGKIALFGGAGVGKTVLIQEMINRIAELRRHLRCSPAWERPRGQRPLVELPTPNVLKDTALGFGEMDELPGTRTRSPVGA